MTVLALTGRTTEAIDLAQIAYARHAVLGSDIGLTSLATHLITLCLALQEHGSLDDAEALALAGYEGSVDAGSLTGQTWFALNLSRIALIPGTSDDGGAVVSGVGVGGRFRRLAGPAVDGPRRAGGDDRTGR